MHTYIHTYITNGFTHSYTESVILDLSAGTFIILFLFLIYFNAKTERNEQLDALSLCIMCLNTTSFHEKI